LKNFGANWPVALTPGCGPVYVAKQNAVVARKEMRGMQESDSMKSLSHKLVDLFKHKVVQ